MLTSHPNAAEDYKRSDERLMVRPAYCARPVTATHSADTARILEDAAPASPPLATRADEWIVSPGRFAETLVADCRAEREARQDARLHMRIGTNVSALGLTGPTRGPDGC